MARPIQGNSSRFIALCATISDSGRCSSHSSQSLEFCADCRHCQHAFDCKATSLCVCVRVCMYRVCHGNCVKAFALFHTLQTWTSFYCCGVLKVPTRKRVNSKLFFHSCCDCYPTPTPAVTATNCIVLCVQKNSRK